MVKSKQHNQTEDGRSTKKSVKRVHTSYEIASELGIGMKSYILHLLKAFCAALISATEHTFFGLICEMTVGERTDTTCFRATRFSPMDGYQIGEMRANVCP